MSPLSSCIILAAFGLASQTVFAQAGARPQLSPRSEYRACLNENDKLGSKLITLQQRAQQHNKALKAHQDEMAAHVATQNALDMSNQVEVDLFNSKINQLNEQVTALNEQADTYQKEDSAYNAEVAAWNKRCASMVVTLKDRDAVRKERQAQDKQ